MFFAHLVTFTDKHSVVAVAVRLFRFSLVTERDGEEGMGLLGNNSVCFMIIFMIIMIIN